ncbi:hypothetical protein ACFUCQ_12275 [Streptomyces sp. NPDC057197]|uniref:hypothetical protein n=1 Tax=Streptomyces sp. NPDC057197 TaxID=3346045 RepID=UPI003631EC12
MDPVSVALLGALAGGAGGELGQQAWAGLTALVRRPFRRSADDGGADGGTPPVVPGQRELARLGEDPGDPRRARELSAALARRALWDTGFRHDLEAWYARTRTLGIEEGAVRNTVSGGTQNGPVLQGRDFSGVSFGAPPPPPPPAPPPSPAPRPAAPDEDPGD